MLCTLSLIFFILLTAPRRWQGTKAEVITWWTRIRLCASWARGARYGLRSGSRTSRIETRQTTSVHYNTKRFIFCSFVLLGYHITKRIPIFVALIYELNCANLSLFGNLNKKKKVKDLWKKMVLWVMNHSLSPYCITLETFTPIQGSLDFLSTIHPWNEILKIESK